MTHQDTRQLETQPRSLGQNVRIVLVEDEPLVRSFVTDCLSEGLGFGVSATDNPLAVLGLLPADAVPAEWRTLTDRVKAETDRLRADIGDGPVLFILDRDLGGAWMKSCGILETDLGGAWLDGDGVALALQRAGLTYIRHASGASELELKGAGTVNKPANPVALIEAVSAAAELSVPLDTLANLSMPPRPVHRPQPETPAGDPEMVRFEQAIILAANAYVDSVVVSNEAVTYCVPAPVSGNGSSNAPIVFETPSSLVELFKLCARADGAGQFGGFDWERGAPISSAACWLRLCWGRPSGEASTRRSPRVRLIARAVCLVLLLAGAAFWFGLPRLRPMPTFGFIAGQALLAAMWLSMHTHGRERGSVLR